MFRPAFHHSLGSIPDQDAMIEVPIEHFSNRRSSPPLLSPRRWDSFIIQRFGDTSQSFPFYTHREDTPDDRRLFFIFDADDMLSDAASIKTTIVCKNFLIAVTVH